MPPPYNLEGDVLREIDKCFSVRDRYMVIDKLKYTQLWAEQSGPPARVHLAMIWKAKGDVKTFESIIKYDAGDWRDLLIEAGLADEDWKDTLKRKGIFPEKWAIA